MEDGGWGSKREEQGLSPVVNDGLFFHHTLPWDLTLICLN